MPEIKLPSVALFTAAEPVTGQVTVTATPAEIFAGGSRLANRRKMVIANTHPVLRCRVGSSTVSQQNGFPLEPGASVEFSFDPAEVVEIYAVSEGTSMEVNVIEY